MNTPTSHKIMLTLLAVALPGGLLLLLFPRQTSSLMHDVKSRFQRYRETRQQ